MLPEACVANILSFTTPADTFSSSAVSSVFRVAGDSDFVWEKFLPSDYSHVISRSTDHYRKFSSKKELYRCLCESVLIDNGKKVSIYHYYFLDFLKKKQEILIWVYMFQYQIFKIEKLSGKISYILSPRDLSITWSEQRHYWSWNPRSDSRSLLICIYKSISLV